MARLIFSIGIPGSGKTSVLRKIAEKIQAEYISPDNIRVELLGRVDDHSKDREVWALARSRVAENLKAGRSVVFDSTFSRPDLRRVFIEGGKQGGTTSIEGIFFDVPLEEILKRNSSRKKVVSEEYLHKAFALLQKDPPQMDEGFDVLIRVNEAGDFIEYGSFDSTLITELRALE